MKKSRLWSYSIIGFVLGWIQDIFISIYQWMRSTYYLGKIPGPWRIWMLSDLKHVTDSNDGMRTYFRYVQRLCENRGIGFIFLGLRPHVVLSKYTTIKEFFSYPDDFEKGHVYDVLLPVVGMSMVTCGGTFGRNRRRLLNPIYRREVTNVVPRAAECAVKLLDEIPASDTTTIDAQEISRKQAARTIYYSMTGIYDPEEADIVAKEAYFVEKTANERVFRAEWFLECTFMLYEAGRKFYDAIASCRSIAKKFLTATESNTSQTSFAVASLRGLISQDTLTLEDCINETSTFFDTGYETSALSMCFTMLLLGNHPEIQEKVFQEIREISLGRSVDQLETADIKKFRYLLMCYKESLRLIPPATFFIRRTVRDIHIGSYLIPENTDVIASIISVHHDPEVYPEPEKFIPERFSTEAEKRRDSQAFIPFATGARNCAGYKYAILESLTFLAELLRRYRIESLRKAEDIRCSLGIPIKPKSPMLMRLIPRNEESFSSPVL